MTRYHSCDGVRRRHHMPSQGGTIVAIIFAMMAPALLWGKDEAAFLSPGRNGLKQQLMGTSGSRAIAAGARSATANPFHQPIGASTLVTNAAFWAFALFAGASSVRRMAASRSASQHKFRSCNVVCQAVKLPTPVVLQQETPVVKEPKPTAITPATVVPATMLDLPVFLPPSTAHTTKPQTAACRAEMVGGARCTTTARSIARRARQRKTAARAAASRAGRRAVGSRLQAASCIQEAPALAFDASRQRLKIQIGLRLANQVRSGHMAEMRLPAGSAKDVNGAYSAVLYLIRDYRFKDLYMCNCACGGE